jgi:hypothetical protein
MMRHAQDGRNGSSYTFGTGYPAPMRIPLRKLYLAKMALIMAGVVVLGIAAVLYFWPLVWHPVKRTPFGGMLVPFIVCSGFAGIVVGLYYLVFGAVWAAREQTGVILDAQGYTDSTMLTQLTSVRILWGNVRTITPEADAGSSCAAYVRVGLTDASVYKSYSWFKRLMTHTTYKKRRRYILFGRMLEGIELGLRDARDVIMARGLPVNAQCLAALMNSYLKAWRKEHGRGAPRPVQAIGNPPVSEYARILADGMQDQEGVST